MYGVEHIVEATDAGKRVVLWSNAEDAFGLVFESMKEVESWIAYMRSVAGAVFEGKEKSTVLRHPEITG